MQGNTVILEAREGEGKRCVSPSMSWVGIWPLWRRWGGEIGDEDSTSRLAGPGVRSVPSEEGRAWKGGGVASRVAEALPWKGGDEDPMTRMGSRESRDETFLSRPVLRQSEAKAEAPPEMFGEIRCPSASEEGRDGKHRPVKTGDWRWQSPGEQ